MKKYFILSIMILLCSIGIDGRQAGAYSVTLQKDGIYADVLPESVVNNSASFFKKHVKKTMKYYKKYENADDYTLANEVPDEYRDFIPIAKQIEASDKLVIKNPFFIYELGDTLFYKYYFVAEKNGKRLCLFSIDIDAETGKISFDYDKMIDKYSKYDEKMMEDGALFYKINDIIYEQTPNKTSVMMDQMETGESMDGDSSNIKDLVKKFNDKDYDGKKEQIFEHLTNIKKEKVIKKSEKDLKLELKDEYVEPTKDEKESSRTGIYIAIGAVVIVGIVVVGIVLKKRKRE